jgi:3-oxoacyl-(acyl-carrier-protein) synthase
MNEPHVIIEAISDLSDVWNAWRSGEPLPPQPNAYAHWRDRTIAQGNSMLRGRDRSKIGMILATTKGDIDRLVMWMRGNDAGQTNDAAPTLGDDADAIARALAVGGPVWVVSTACSSGLVALVDGAMAVLDGKVERMLVVGIDVASDFVAQGFASLKAISQTNACRPFDKARDGLMLGSCAAACLLGNEGASPNVPKIAGWGVTSDAVHRSAPDREAGGLTAAMRDALAMARLAPHDIDVLICHGTGTRYNDSMEAVAIQKVFLKDGRRGPAVTAVKGLVGHTLGASAVVEMALAARMIAEQIVLPVTGLRQPEWDCIDFVNEPQRKNIRRIMKVASGFGGGNAAIILSSQGAA